MRTWNGPRWRTSPAIDEDQVVAGPESPGRSHAGRGIGDPPSRTGTARRPPVPNRAGLEGIIFVLKSGMPWQMLPTELGYGSGSTCWRRFRAWTQSGVWPELHRRLLRMLGRRGRINLERAVIDSTSMRALKGGRTPGRTPRIAAKTAVSAIS
jgi:transposase